MATKNYTPIDDLVNKWRQPIVSVPKEAEPIVKSSEQSQLQEAVEHEPSKETKPFVQPKQETIQLPPELTKLGLQPVKSTSFPSFTNVKLPITDEKVMEGLREPVSSSKRWLSEFALFLLKQAHLSLKQVGGKVVRIFRSN